jgi:hypothetical protein
MFTLWLRITIIALTMVCVGSTSAGDQLASSQSNVLVQSTLRVENPPVKGSIISLVEEQSRLHEIVAQIKLADFEDNRAALNDLYQQLTPYLQNENAAPLIHYWRGFALWRRALNGFSDSTSKGDLDADLSQASREFVAAGRSQHIAVEAEIGEAACEGTLIFLHHNEPTELQRHLARDADLMKRLQQAVPNNPRYLWVLGGSLWNRPASAGGSQATATDAYRRGLAAIDDQPNPMSVSVEPTWGKAELLMSLAWSSLHQTAPDLNQADQYARQALSVAPTWHYVRDLLIPQIAQARASNAPAIQVRAAPGSVILYRDVSGSYDQHPTVFNELMQYARRTYRISGQFFGIYPVDPDAAQGDALKWQVGIRVTPGDPGTSASEPIPDGQDFPSAEALKRTLNSLHAPTLPYKLMILDQSEVATVDSTVAHAAQDGLSITPWLALNGYVQIGPTRMEYLSYQGPPEEIKVRILVPVKRRASGLKVSQ